MKDYDCLAFDSLAVSVLVGVCVSAVDVRMTQTHTHEQSHRNTLAQLRRFKICTTELHHAFICAMIRVRERACVHTHTCVFVACVANPSRSRACSPVCECARARGHRALFFSFSQDSLRENYGLILCAVQR